MLPLPYIAVSRPFPGDLSSWVSKRKWAPGGGASMHLGRDREQSGRSVAVDWKLCVPTSQPPLQFLPGQLRSQHQPQPLTRMAGQLHEESRMPGSGPLPCCPLHRAGGSKTQCQLPNFTNSLRQTHKMTTLHPEATTALEASEREIMSWENNQDRHKQNICYQLSFPPL